MTSLDLYWKTNKDWYHYVQISDNEDDIMPVLNDNAPEEAQKSYKNYMNQKKARGMAL